MVAPGDYPVDLAVSYLVAGVLTPSAYLSTASSPASATLTITSWAPHPGTAGAGDSCVWVTDSRTGSITQAAYSGPGAGSSHLFTWGLSLAQSTTEGTYLLSYHAQDCGGSTHLSTSSSTPYVVDNSAPLVFFLTPVDYGNVAFAQAPLAAKVADSGPAGVDGANMRFTLTDESDPARPTWTWQGAGAITWIQASSWAKTPAVTFTQSHVYRLEVRGVDRAGNATTVAQAPASGGGGFLAMSGSGSGHVSISAPCTVGPVKLNGRRDVTCPGVAAGFAGTTVSFSGTRHDGVGRVLQTFSFAGAKLANPALTNVEVDAFALGNTPPQAPVYPASFRVPSGGCPSSAPCSAPGSSVAAGTVTTEVLAAWAGDAAVLTLEADTGSAQTPPTLWMDACADPTVASAVCVPDPVRLLPPLGSDLSLFDPRAIFGSRLNDGEIVVPARARPPDWASDQAVQGACLDGVPMPVSTPIGPSWAGIRPGGWLIRGCEGLPDGLTATPYSCTLAFVFEDTGSFPRQKAISTAGHCFDDWTQADFQQGRKVLVLARDPTTGTDPETNTLQLVPIGSPVLVWNDTRVWPPPAPGDSRRNYDFAMIQIDPLYRSWISSTTALILGPCGVQSTDPGANTLLKYIGHGQYIGTGGMPREGQLLDWTAPARRFLFRGAVTGGDSGSPVELSSNGLSAGLVVEAAHMGNVLGVRLKDILDGLIAQDAPQWQLTPGTIGCV